MSEHAGGGGFDEEGRLLPPDPSGPADGEAIGDQADPSGNDAAAIAAELAAEAMPHLRDQAEAGAVPGGTTTDVEGLPLEGGPEPDQGEHPLPQGSTSGQAQASPEVDTPGSGWVTLREASEQAEVSVSALRKWYRAGDIGTRRVKGGTGEQVLVHLDEVRARKARTIAWQAPTDVVEPVRTEVADELAAPPLPGPVASGDYLPIPRDEWARVLDQLGNLHEAGQQLAEARERAARAEAVEEFLRERVRELEAKAAAVASAAPPPAARPEPVAEGGGEGWNPPGGWGATPPGEAPRRRWWSRR